MKKSLPKPENWQDFETLCKKLFGEVWSCKNTIKKNGRNGQWQAGVDIYAKPKGEDGFFGIQCKGKDDYTQAKLTAKEIRAEIVKAKKFEPKLKVFIIATTANKDAAIEKLVRQEDLKSSLNGGFEILLYAWEELVDLIEENRETYQWYINEQQFRHQYECLLSFDGEPTYTIRPVYVRKTIKYITEEEEDTFLHTGLGKILGINSPMEIMLGNSWARTQKQQFNYTICPVKLTITNTGSKVLEDWKLRLKFDPSEVKKLMDKYEGETRGVYEALPSAIFRSIQIRAQALFVNEQELSVLYKPAENHPLIQKDSRSFSLWLQPHGHEQQGITLKWELLARDYSDQGEMVIKIEPELQRSFRQVVLEDGEQRPDETTITEKIDDKIAD